MAASLRTLGQRLLVIGVFLVVLWGMLLVKKLVKPSEMDSFALVPRTLSGLVGVLTMPLVHQEVSQLLNNTFPLAILLVLLAGSKSFPWRILAGLWLGGGLILWSCGKPEGHWGAAPVIFGLISFLILAGFLEKTTWPMLVSFLVGVLYGGTLLWGIVPWLAPDHAWDSHLCGTAGGVAVACVLFWRPLRKPPLPRP